MPQDQLTVAAVNFAPEWGNKDANLARIIEQAGEAADRGAQIVVFPEMALTGYNHDGGSVAMHEENAETVPGTASEALAALARERGIWILVGLPERDAASGAIYNSALVVGPEGPVGCYRKIHPAGEESLWCRKGDEPLLFDTPWGPVGVGICYDTYCFPELARYYAAKGARLYLNPTAVPAVMDWGSLYYTQLKARALENAGFIVSANLVGPDKGLTFPGGSLVIGPGKETLAPVMHAGPVEGEEAILLADIDLTDGEVQLARLPIMTRNPITGVPDWRPAVYSRILGELMESEGWRGGR